MRKQDIKVGEWYGYTSRSTYGSIRPLLVVALDGVTGYNSHRYYGVKNIDSVSRTASRAGIPVFLGVVVTGDEVGSEFDLWAQDGVQPSIVPERHELARMALQQIPDGEIKLGAITVPDGFRVVTFTSRQLRGTWLAARGSEIAEQRARRDRVAKAGSEHQARKARFAELSTLAARANLRLAPTLTYGEGSFLHATVPTDQLTALLTELAAQRADDSI
jgi:hypothetical protein